MLHLKDFFSAQSGERREKGKTAATLFFSAPILSILAMQSVLLNCGPEDPSQNITSSEQFNPDERISVKSDSFTYWIVPNEKYSNALINSCGSVKKVPIYRTLKINGVHYPSDEKIFCLEKGAEVQVYASKASVSKSYIGIKKSSFFKGSAGWVSQTHLSTFNPCYGVDSNIWIGSGQIVKGSGMGGIVELGLIKDGDRIVIISGPNAGEQIKLKSGQGYASNGDKWTISSCDDNKLCVVLNQQKPKRTIHYLLGFQPC